MVKIAHAQKEEIKAIFRHQRGQGRCTGGVRAPVKRVEDKKRTKKDKHKPSLDRLLSEDCRESIKNWRPGAAIRTP